jgi:hypothetical protein
VVHAVCLTLAGASMLAIPAIHDRGLLFLPMIGVGLAWASIMGNPYVMLAGSIPPSGSGVYMGIFNMFIVIPMMIQIFTLPLVLPAAARRQPRERDPAGGRAAHLRRRRRVVRADARRRVDHRGQRLTSERSTAAGAVGRRAGRERHEGGSGAPCAAPALLRSRGRGPGTAVRPRAIRRRGRSAGVGPGARDGLRRLLHGERLVLVGLDHAPGGDGPRAHVVDEADGGGGREQARAADHDHVQRGVRVVGAEHRARERAEARATPTISGMTMKKLNTPMYTPIRCCGMAVESMA